MEDHSSLLQTDFPGFTTQAVPKHGSGSSNLWFLLSLTVPLLGMSTSHASKPTSSSAFRVPSFIRQRQLPHLELAQLALEFLTHVQTIVKQFLILFLHL